MGESRWQASECTDTLGGRSVRIREREMRDSEHVSVLLQDSCRSECTRCKGVLTQWLSAAAVADCSRHVWTNQGQICEAHRGALAHAHKTTGLSPHRLPCRGNPGILLYTKDMMSATTDGALGAFAAGTQRHGWCSALLNVAYVARPL